MEPGKETGGKMVYEATRPFLDKQKNIVRIPGRPFAIEKKRAVELGDLVKIYGVEVKDEDAEKQGDRNKDKSKRFIGSDI
ncbi:MAG: hypothetical protein ACOX4U_00470 [Anaerovoracaceae bacterium]|jgi:hypothetical protein